MTGCTRCARMMNDKCRVAEGRPFCGWRTANNWWSVATQGCAHLRFAPPCARLWSPYRALLMAAIQLPIYVAPSGLILRTVLFRGLRSQSSLHPRLSYVAPSGLGGNFDWWAFFSSRWAFFSSRWAFFSSRWAFFSEGVGYICGVIYCLWR